MSNNKQPTIDEKFFRYHADNPQIFKIIKKYTAQVKDVGFQHYSMDAIMHRVRWHVNVKTRSYDGFKINNNFTSRYARLLEKENKDLRGFFNKRKLRGPSILMTGAK
jgi:hypothetical protein